MEKSHVYVALAGSVSSGVVFFALTGSLTKACLASLASLSATMLLLGAESWFPASTGRRQQGPKQ